MKKIIIILAIASICFTHSKAQIKMVAKSTYSFNGIGFAILDTSTYFNNPANPNPVNENCNRQMNSIVVTTKTSLLLGVIFFFKSFIS
jgi:hypothetical protein